MANTEYLFCPTCRETTEHYNLEPGLWECEVCGRYNEEESDLDNDCSDEVGCDADEDDERKIEEFLKNHR